MASQEVRPYTLNVDRAVRKKLKLPFLCIEEKCKGQCLVAQLDLPFFQEVCTACVRFYKESGRGHVSEVVDGNGSLVEVKIAVEQARRKVQLTLYNTKNKVMLQGSKTAVDWWQSTHLPVVLETVPASVRSSMDPVSDLPPVSCLLGAPTFPTKSASSGSLPTRPRSPMDAVSVSSDLPPVSDLDGAATESTSSGSLSARPRSPIDPAGTTTEHESEGTIKSVLERLDRLEESMADLFGVMSADKLNLVREATTKEINVITTQHRAVVDNLRGEIRMKDGELGRLRGETTELKRAIRRKEEGANEASKKIGSLNGEVARLKDLLSKRSDDVEVANLREEVENLRRLLRLRHDEISVCGDVTARSPMDPIGPSVSDLVYTTTESGTSGTLSTRDRSPMAAVSAKKSEVGTTTESGTSKTLSARGRSQMAAVSAKKSDAVAISSAEKESGSGAGVGGALDGGWRTVPPSRFKVPDVLVVGNSNVRGLDAGFLHPKFVVKRVLDDKSLRGAAAFLQSTDIRPRGNIVIQALDNDIGEVSNDNIVRKLEEIVRICRSRFPGVMLHVFEPLGRCNAVSPHVYWANADRLCGMISAVEGIHVVRVPARLKRADSSLFLLERGGFVHLNGKGVGVLTGVYRDGFLGVCAPGTLRNGVDGSGTEYTAGGKDVYRSRGESRVFDRNGGGSRGGKTGERGMGVGSDGSKADRNGGGQFGLLVRTLIDGLSRFA